MIQAAPEAPTWCALFFTSPGSGIRNDNPLNGLTDAIRGARESVHLAFYEISCPDVAHEIIAAKKRGLSIKIVTESDNSKSGTVSLLHKNGIPIVTDSRKGLMHNKFAVIDNSIVWTGSYNATINGSTKNNNNALLIRSEALAEIYGTEFTEMFEHRIFGNRTETAPFQKIAKKYHVRIGETDINAYFSPDDNIERIILSRLRKARASIRFMAFAFTSDRLGDMIIEKHRQGLDVLGVMEKRGSGSKYSEYVKMRVEGLPVRLDKNRFAMHHKVIIIDSDLVITGSYNFTSGANKKNDENILIIHDSAIARAYLNEFNRLYR